MAHSEARLVFMEDVFSNEYYRRAGSAPAQVLRGVSFAADAGQCWGILGNSVFEIMLLAEIMAGARTYQRGVCSLSGHGMMRRKRTVLPHTLYLGSTNMLFENMKVLEYLMFATSKTGADVLDRQQQALDRLIETGLDHLTLVPIELLTPPQKAAVLLLCATFSPSSLVILNLPRLQYDDVLLEALGRIAQLLRDGGKALVFTTESFEVAQALSTHILLVRDGAVVHGGKLDDFLRSYDKAVFTLSCDGADQVLPRLQAALPQYAFAIEPPEENVIEVHDPDGAGAPADLFAALGSLDVAPNSVLRSRPSLRNAYRGFMRQHDL